MKTLYDLLEALPDDDADALRAAFRKAAKANHPDFNPGNPEASERFRRIIRANAILSDQQQRAEYDRLLELAKKQQASPPKGPLSKRRVLYDTLHRLAADATTSAIVSVVLIGGYFAYRSAERVPLASAQAVEIVRSEPTQIIADKPAEIADASNQAEERTRPQSVEADNSEQDVNQQVAGKPAKPDAPALVTDGAAAADAFTSPPGDNGTKDIAFYRERGMRAYRSGELYLALANFGVAIDLDPGSPDSYVDRGIVFHRLGDLKRALSDVAEAKRLDDLNRKQYAPQIGAP